MYTYTQDQQQADKIMNYIRYNPYCTRKDIIINCITNAHRLKYLEQQGLIVLPDPMPRHKRNKSYWNKYYAQYAK